MTAEPTRCAVSAVVRQATALSAESPGFSATPRTGWDRTSSALLWSRSWPFPVVVRAFPSGAGPLPSQSALAVRAWAPAVLAAAAVPAWAPAGLAARATAASRLKASARSRGAGQGLGLAVLASASPPVHLPPAPPAWQSAAAGSDWAVSLGFPAPPSQARRPPACPAAEVERIISANQR